MRAAILTMIAIGISGCGPSDPSNVSLVVGKAQRVNGCHILLHHALAHTPPIADVSYVCGVSESAVNEKNWWGNGTQPPAFSVSVGDCVRLDETFYCVKEIEPGKSISIRATYKQKHRNGELLERVR